MAPTDPPNPPNKAYGINNIRTFVPLTLDFDKLNYDAWSELFTTHCNAFDVIDHIDTTTPKPTDDEWKKVDSVVKLWIYGTISQALLQTVLKKDATALQVWTTLENLFGENKDARCMQLDTELRNIVMGDLSVNAYCTKMNLTHLDDQEPTSTTHKFSPDLDDLVHVLRTFMIGLDSIEDQKQAVMQLRLLTKNTPENRVKIARVGAIRSLISLISSSDPQLQEISVTTILNLSLSDENNELLSSSGAIGPLVTALEVGTPAGKENAAYALLRLCKLEENKTVIGRSGAIPLLVDLLETGRLQGKKDASTALYCLCSVIENKVRAVEAGIMKPLVELMVDFGSNMVDKSAFVACLLASLPEARASLVEEGGIPVLVEMVEVVSQRQKEIAAVILLQLCDDDSVVYCTMVAREGAIPPLVALSQSGTNRAKQTAEALIELLRRTLSDNPSDSSE
ncbi:hypothetical protein OSB04_003074 [Centaurea solstitialis]|uniref:U-box domain-containing protein n=1 Tax=Centaurea solstitialis TaxID=347529 RepID=A0AA38U1P3_9ASTR|nr:hypothetical protein OSB04_003074 [Centaurea solstitialis]